jgi:hypothetical protein
MKVLIVIATLAVAAFAAKMTPEEESAAFRNHLVRKKIEQRTMRKLKLFNS